MAENKDICEKTFFFLKRFGQDGAAAVDAGSVAFYTDYKCFVLVGGIKWWPSVVAMQSLKREKVKDRGREQWCRTEWLRGRAMVILLGGWGTQ